MFDASCLLEANVKIGFSGYLYLGNDPEQGLINNRAIDIVSNIIHTIMASAAEAEYVTIYTNPKYAIPQRTALLEMDHQQPATPIWSDNQTATGIANQ